MNAASLPEIARQMMGEPNPALSTSRELRWGRKGSFAVSIERERWRDFETDEGGDLIDLIRREYRCSYPAALQILGEDAIERQSTPKAKAGSDDRARRNGDLALNLWREAKPIAGTPAEAYLIGRGLHLGGDLRSEDLRYHPSCPMREDRSPALLCLFRGMATAEPRGIQRIPITTAGMRAMLPDGTKAPKLTLGNIRGAGTMLTGPWLDSPYVGVCEGPETGIALVNAGERMVWALGGTSGLHAMPLLFDRYPCSLVVFADADPPGQAAARAACNRYAEAGREGLIISPTIDGADFGDLAA